MTPADVRALVERLRQMDHSGCVPDLCSSWEECQLDREAAAALESLLAKVREYEELISEVVDPTVLIDGFPAMRGTPDLPVYLAEQRRKNEEWAAKAEARVKTLLADRERLDWLQEEFAWVEPGAGKWFVYNWAGEAISAGCLGTGVDLRTAIDAARKGEGE